MSTELSLPPSVQDENVDLRRRQVLKSSGLAIAFL
jgi:hypothetical protein